MLSPQRTEEWKIAIIKLGKKIHFPKKSKTWLSFERSTLTILDLWVEKIIMNRFLVNIISEWVPRLHLLFYAYCLLTQGTENTWRLGRGGVSCCRRNWYCNLTKWYLMHHFFTSSLELSATIWCSNWKFHCCLWKKIERNNRI